MSAGTQIAPVVASVNIVELTTQKKLRRPYPEVNNYFIKKFANDQVLAEMNSAIPPDT